MVGAVWGILVNILNRNIDEVEAYANASKSHKVNKIISSALRSADGRLKGGEYWVDSDLLILVGFGARPVFESCS